MLKGLTIPLPLYVLSCSILSYKGNFQSNLSPIHIFPTFLRYGFSMIKKMYSPQRRICQVYFRIEPSMLTTSLSNTNMPQPSLSHTSKPTKNILTKDKSQMCLLGCFTEWQPIPMQQRSDGSFSIAYTLDASKQYQFRYLYEKTHWIEEPDSDGTESNPFGSKNCVLQT